MPRTATQFRIEDHVLLGNGRAAALSTPDGTVDWLCLPDFDSPAVLAGLLGIDAHGMWRIGPATGGGTPPVADRRRYLGHSTVVEQTWHTAGGTLTVTDFLPAPDAADHAPAQLIRIAACTEGTVTVSSALALRPNYGAALPVVHPVEFGTPRTRLTHGGDRFWLDGPTHTGGRHGDQHAEQVLAAGQQLVFALTWSATGQPAPAPPTGAELAATLRWWDDWAGECTYTGPDRDAVLRSAITLKAMQQVDTGAFVAAPTTSLPERLPTAGQPGEDCRTWDYRHMWPRDSAWYISTLLKCGFTEEALMWRHWLLARTDPKDLRPLYRLDGGTGTAERILAHLPGWRGAGPVRVGNGADGQLQLDVFGELADTLWQMEQAGLPGGGEVREYVLQLALQVEKLWRQRDSGMWESRGEPQRYTSSRIWCWVALDRAARMLRTDAGTDPAVVVRLEELAATVRATVLACAVRTRDGGATVLAQVFGGTGLDASVLHAVTTGMLAPDDPLAAGTIDAVAAELTNKHGLVERYPTHDDAENIDGLPGHEGRFLPCTAWLATAYATTGRITEARTTIDTLLALRSDLGLLSEGYDPAAGCQLGNYPQGMSHQALIDALLALAAAEHRATPKVLTLADALA
ncbi:glycoside hydrolase family 15 protein [Kitasatospora griseola]